jgi:hypothetical protein
LVSLEVRTMDGLAVARRVHRAPLGSPGVLACSRFAEKLDLLRYQRDARNRRSTVIGRMNS